MSAVFIVVWLFAAFSADAYSKPPPDWLITNITQEVSTAVQKLLLHELVGKNQIANRAVASLAAEYCHNQSITIPSKLQAIYY